MELNVLRPRKALSHAYARETVLKGEIEMFRTQLDKLVRALDTKEGEEHVKGHISEFLKKIGFGDHYLINTRDRADLAIYLGETAENPVGVLFEVKRPGNKSEMISRNDVNRKAFHELLLYYLRERIERRNIQLRNLIITNGYEWFIFDAHEFERHFAENTKLVSTFNSFNAGHFSGEKTSLFYEDIAKPTIEKIQGKLTFTHIDLRKSENIARLSAAKITALYKIFSPTHLLKLPFGNDSNTLNRAFYEELLHILGLAEYSEGTKKVIGRKKVEDRDPGSLIENTIGRLDTEDRLTELPDAKHYGASVEERLFNVALELNITWLNRILFLKLLEAQLIRYHKGDRRQRFLTVDMVHEFDDLNELFFEVLAVKGNDRKPHVAKKYGALPYLNSSLFSQTLMESKTVRINSLKDRFKLPLFSRTILKDARGKRLQDELPTLEYLLRFLDAYDFASEGSGEIMEERKSLINASVLGLIFEKINGYREGSVYTPGYITMFMSRKAVRGAIVTALNREFDWECTSLEEVYNVLEPKDIAKANTAINSLKICDPAVGSGHFLVSVLNEILAAKAELGILCDRQNRRLKHYSVQVDRDELVITDDEGEFFEYLVSLNEDGTRHIENERQRVQEVFFHEKKTIIEQCLFGVDINANSVNICRLRLWIELLKHTYYTAESKFSELETLPNIDIKIKRGNSVLSRYPVTTPSDKFPKSLQADMNQYRAWVSEYLHTTDRNLKHELENNIAKIKDGWIGFLPDSHPDKVKERTLAHELIQFNSDKLFNEDSPPAVKEREQKRKNKLEQQLGDVREKMEKFRKGEQYHDAFEWRLEFPEVLDEAANFVGFDVVIGNPPYVRHEQITPMKPFLKDAYETFDSAADLFTYFYERGWQLLRPDGIFAFVSSNKYFRAKYGKKLRHFLSRRFQLYKLIDFGDAPVFEGAAAYPSILMARKARPDDSSLQIYEWQVGPDLVDFEAVFRNKSFAMPQTALQPEGWRLERADERKLLQKLQNTRGYLKNGN